MERPGEEHSWWEDPHLSLDRLTPGQRYTLLLVVLLAVLLLRFGLPQAGSSSAPSGTVPSPSITVPTTMTVR